MSPPYLPGFGPSNGRARTLLVDEKPVEQARKGDVRFAAGHEGRYKIFRTAIEQQRTAFHEISWHGANATRHDNSAGDHAITSIVAAALEDCDDTPAKTVSRIIARLAVNNQDTAFHAYGLTRERCADIVSGTAFDLDAATRHAGTRHGRQHCLQ